MADKKELREFERTIVAAVDLDVLVMPNVLKGSEDKWEKWKAEHGEETLKALDMGGAKIVKVDPGEVNKYFHLQKDGKKFILSFIETPQRRKDVALMLKNFSKVVEAYERMKGWEDPFYSNISGILDGIFKTRGGRREAFSVVCDWLRKDGIRIWS